MIQPSEKIYLDLSKNEKAGRGVFALTDINQGDVIEICPVIEMTATDSARLKETELLNYYFMWGEGKEAKKVAICLGFGSLYNHSYEPNATYQKNLNERVIEFIAIQRIKKGEEITVNYNYGNPEDRSALWIKSIDPYKPKI